MAQFCKNCSTENPDDARFCRNCGADLTAAPAPGEPAEGAMPPAEPTPAVPASDAAPAGESPSAGTPQSAPPPTSAAQAGGAAPVATAAPARSNTKAIISLILGIAGFFFPFFGFAAHVAAIILGQMGRNDAKRDPEIGGSGMALAGLILGAIGVGLYVLTFVIIIVIVIIAAATGGSHSHSSLAGTFYPL